MKEEHNKEENPSGLCAEERAREKRERDMEHKGHCFFFFFAYLLHIVISLKEQAVAALLVPGADKHLLLLRTKADCWIEKRKT